MSQQISPSPDHSENANHSDLVKLPGMPGTTFIRMIDTLTAAPSEANSTGSLLSRIFRRRAR